MSKSIYFIGACAVAAAAIFVWSQNAPVASLANTPLVGTPTTPVMSPTEMMINHNNPLPVEKWDAF